MKEAERKKLAKEIREFADALKDAPLVGARIEVSGGNGGPTTGLFISVSSDPSGRSVTGMEINVNSSDMGNERNEQVDRLLAVADAVEAGMETSLIKRMLSGLATAAGNAGLSEAFARIFDSL